MDSDTSLPSVPETNPIIPVPKKKATATRGKKIWNIFTSVLAVALGCLLAFVVFSIFFAGC